MDKIIFNMATMPSRVNSLKPTVESILPQCDVLNIYLNNFETVPEFLKQPKINCFLSSDYFGDLGDVGKFVKLGFCKGYFFTVDDKFNYPPDYAKKLIDAIEKYNRKIIVSLHGRFFHTDRQSKNYYYDAKQFFGCLTEVKDDMFVHELGTGVQCFHTSTLPKSFNMSMFKYTNMTDIIFSLECQKLNIPLMVLAHKEAYLKIFLNHNENNSIHATLGKKDQIQTNLINSIRWKQNSL